MRSRVFPISQDATMIVEPVKKCSYCNNTGIVMGFPKQYNNDSDIEWPPEEECKHCLPPFQPGQKIWGAGWFKIVVQPNEAISNPHYYIQYKDGTINHQPQYLLAKYFEISKKWRPPQKMPKLFSRYHGTIKSVKCIKVEDISWEDAEKCGFDFNQTIIAMNPEIRFLEHWNNCSTHIWLYEVEKNV